ncbi:MAG: hypothetical protein ACO39T_05550, partial [Flavobacteriaceae bacterium]
ASTTALKRREILFSKLHSHLLTTSNPCPTHAVLHLVVSLSDCDRIFYSIDLLKIEEIELISWATLDNASKLC